MLGLAAYHYIASRLGEHEEATWASQEYASLLAATNAELTATIAENHLDYLPCSLVQPNTANRCSNPMDANWTSPFGFGAWAWEAGLLGAPVDGPGLTMIDATYAYGFGRLEGLLPADTTGGFPDDFYSSAYNAENGMAGLASQGHRDQGILDYEFMLANTQSGPFSWWESSSAPDPASPWVGLHPAGGQGSSPHAWGIAGANKVLLDSLVAQEASGALVVGRGIPPAWLRRGARSRSAISPTTGGRRLAVDDRRLGSTRHPVRCAARPQDRSSSSSLLSSHNVAATTSGTVAQSSRDRHDSTDRALCDRDAAPAAGLTRQTARTGGSTAIRAEAHGDARAVTTTVVYGITNVPTQRIHRLADPRQECATLLGRQVSEAAEGGYLVEPLVARVRALPGVAPLLVGIERSALAQAFGRPGRQCRVAVEGRTIPHGGQRSREHALVDPREGPGDVGGG